MKRCNLMVTRYRDGEMLHSYYKEWFKSKKEGQDRLKRMREFYDNNYVETEDFDDSVMDFRIIRSNKNEFIFETERTDYGMGSIIFRDEYKIV